MSNAQEFIDKELDLRTKIATDPNFINTCVNVAKKVGITAEEWNENKAVLLMYFANIVISEDNKKGEIIRKSFNK